MLRFIDAGESHGKCLLGIVEGFPEGMPLNLKLINDDLKRRQGGYGRGLRMNIEQDNIEILSGVIAGKTIGSPIGLLINNKDWIEEPLSNSAEKERFVIPRPGHADLAGVLKYGLDNYGVILERASARITAMRVAIGSLARQFLEYFSIYSYSHVIGIGSILIDDNTIDGIKKELSGIKEIKGKINKSRVYCLEEKISEEMCIEIDGAKKEGDTLGGIFEVVIGNVPVGLGSHVYWTRRIDARIAGAIMSIPGVKAIEIGRGMKSAQSRGSQAQDAIYYKKTSELKNSNKSNFYRKQNWAGGIEGGITNGEEIIVRAYLKPIPTLSSPLPSVNLRSKKESPANYQRSDCCVVPAASVIGEAVVCWEIAAAFLEKFAGDSLKEIKENFNNYQKRIKDC